LLNKIQFLTIAKVGVMLQVRYTLEPTLSTLVPNRGVKVGVMLQVRYTLEPTLSTLVPNRGVKVGVMLQVRYTLEPTLSTLVPNRGVKASRPNLLEVKNVRYCHKDYFCLLQNRRHPMNDLGALCTFHVTNPSDYRADFEIRKLVEVPSLFEHVRFNCALFNRSSCNCS
jgi:hypothetical protein